MALTDKQRRFVAEYLVDLNATQAAIRCGYSPKTAKQQGARLLTNADVAAAVAEAQQKRQERTEITQDRVLRELACIAFGDIRKVFTDDGRLKRPEELDDDTAAALASVEVVTRPTGDGHIEHVHKVKAWDKLKALELLGRHLKMFTEKHEHTVSDEMAQLLGLINGGGRPRPGS